MCFYRFDCKWYEDCFTASEKYQVPSGKPHVWRDTKFGCRQGLSAILAFYYLSFFFIPGKEIKNQNFCAFIAYLVDLCMICVRIRKGGKFCDCLVLKHTAKSIYSSFYGCSRLGSFPWCLVSKHTAKGTHDYRSMSSLCILVYVRIRICS